MSEPGLDKPLIDPDDPCQYIGCTRMDGKCVGWHCSYCGKPCSSQGHFECPERPKLNV